MVDLLKRNHDAMMHKYETYRQRNETLESENIDKGKLYHQMKSENEHLSNDLYHAKRAAEEFRQSV